MITVEVKLVSAIHESRSKTLGTMIIANDGTGNKTRRNYTVATKGRKGRVENYPAEAVAIWNLIRRACEAAGYNK